MRGKFLIIQALLLCLFGVISPAFTSNPASALQAETVIVNATVLPLRTIIVDENGTIQEITSNTKDNIAPQVCLLTCQATILPSRNIMEQYRKIMSHHDTSQPGIIYRAKPEPTSHRPIEENKYSILNILLNSPEKPITI